MDGASCMVFYTSVSHQVLAQAVMTMLWFHAASSFLLLLLLHHHRGAEGKDRSETVSFKVAPGGTEVHTVPGLEAWEEIKLKWKVGAGGRQHRLGHREGEGIQP